MNEINQPPQNVPPPPPQIPPVINGPRVLGDDPAERIPIKNIFGVIEAVLRQPRRLLFKLRQPGAGRLIGGMLFASGDLYLTFAKQAGAVPPDATKASHAKERDQFKIVALAVGYGMGEKSLAVKLGVPEYQAKELLNLHRRTYPAYWAWSNAAEAKAVLTGKLTATFGWRIHALGADANPRSLRNFPAQANGAEMIRIACCLAIQRGIELCCPIHDALLVEGPVDRVDEIVAATQLTMRDASEFVLPGFPLRTDAKVVMWPDRYMDPRGKKMWSTVCEILREGGHALG